MGDKTLAHRRGGAWIPLMDFAIRRGVSLSTLRRHIKANKVQYRVENGRYLLWDDQASSAAPTTGVAPSVPSTPSPAAGAAAMNAKLLRLEQDLQKAQEEIAELKMLIALYEEKISRDRLDS